MNCVGGMWWVYQNMNQFGELKLLCTYFFSLLTVNDISTLIWDMRKRKLFSINSFKLCIYVSLKKQTNKKSAND